MLDLDETLIHSHEQRTEFESRSAKLNYYADLVQKFVTVNGRNPNEEELEQLPFQLFFDVRPFVVQFIQSLAEQFEIVIFTAAE